MLTQSLIQTPASSKNWTYHIAYLYICCYFCSSGPIAVMHSWNKINQPSLKKKNPLKNTHTHTPQNNKHTHTNAIKEKKNKMSTDMDYTSSLTCVGYVIILMCAYTNEGCRADRQRVSTTFLTREKLSQVFLVRLMGFQPRVLESRVQRSTNWALTLSAQTDGL